MMRKFPILLLLFLSVMAWADVVGLQPENDSKPAGGGCLIASVGPKSVAETAGLVSGDLILEAGETPIDSVERLREVIAKSGADLSLQIRRGDRVDNVVAHFDARKSDRRLGILCGPPLRSSSLTVEVSSVTVMDNGFNASESTKTKEAPTLCPYTVSVNTKVRLSLKDGRTLSGKLLRCDADQIAIRTGLMYRVFDDTKVANLEAR